MLLEGCHALVFIFIASVLLFPGFSNWKFAQLYDERKFTYRRRAVVSIQINKLVKLKTESGLFIYLQFRCSSIFFSTFSLVFTITPAHTFSFQTIKTFPTVRHHRRGFKTLEIDVVTLHTRMYQSIMAHRHSFFPPSLSLVPLLQNGGSTL